MYYYFTHIRNQKFRPILHNFWSITERAFREKIQSTETYKAIQCCALDFSRKTRSVMVTKNGIFFQSGISPLILAYAILNLHHKIAQLTIYLQI